MKAKLATAALAAAISFLAYAQEKPAYIPPLEQDVKDNIAQWQDLKFGMFIHWGAYSQIGVVESWSICPEDIEWQYNRRGDNYFEYLNMYENLRKVFNPVKFEPEKWAEAAEYAGMKYVVFTTKHHDGFCMYDTKLTDYKITDQASIFHENPRSNIAKEIFNAFRDRGIQTGAYLSIADWHNEDYWWRFFPPKDHYINYDAEKRPEKWQRFQDFVVGQVDELTNGDYGKLNLLWFDLCTPSVKYKAPMDWERIAATARRNQPGIMTVARYTHTIYENYITPEQEIPDTALDCPWESCITMTSTWSWRKVSAYKPTREILDMLVSIVSRGGNLLLNVGPSPLGELDATAYERLREIGDWMKINSEAIYGTRAHAPYQTGNVYYTEKDGKVYAFYMAAEGEEVIPSEVNIGPIVPSSVKGIRMLGCKGYLKWTETESGTTVKIPESIRRSLPCQHIWCLEIR